MYRSDWVGTVVTADERPLVANSFRSGEIVEATVELTGLKEQVRVLAIPVRWNGEVIGVATRESALTFGRHPGELERTYVEIFNRFARMIAAGVFPFATDDPEPEEAPRVGDGVMLLDAQGRVVYTSPNAVSALHRVGVHANAEGMRLGELGLDETSFARPSPFRARSSKSSSRVPRSRCCSAVSRCWNRGRCRARSCSCATSPSCGAVTGCCSRRTPPSKRSTTG